MPDGFLRQNFQKRSKQKMCEYHHRILHTENSPGTKFQLIN